MKRTVRVGDRDPERVIELAQKKKARRKARQAQGVVKVRKPSGNVRGVDIAAGNVDLHRVSSHRNIVDYKRGGQHREDGRYRSNDGSPA